MKYPAYPKYKPSGVEWLGEVPEHWRISRANAMFRFVSGGTPSTDEKEYWDGDIPWVSPKDMKVFEISDTEDHVTELGEKESSTTSVSPNTLLLVMRSGILRHSLPVAITARRMTINQDIKAFVPIDKEIYVKYFGRFIEGQQTQLLAEWRKEGATVESLEKDLIKIFKFPIPPFAEQSAIADFLDHQTAKLDTLISKKQALIERLKAKRTALISRTVTRGLPPEAARAAGFDPQPKLRDSGIEWLGEIPEHWETKPVKYIGNIGNGSTPARDNSNYWEDGRFPWLNSSVANLERITSSDEFVTATALKECHLPVIKPPAVLVGITGQGKTRGLATTLMIEATINQHLAYIKPTEKVMTVGYLRRIFDNSYSFIRSESDGSGSTKGAITCEQIANLKIPVPPLSEQIAIAAYLDRETAQLDALAAKVEQAIQRLRDYRTALITAAVTGKIDVRGFGR